jgi:porphobilinogen deaminase
VYSPSFISWSAQVESVRGNVHTRLSKLNDPETAYRALILAEAGLRRLKLGRYIRATFGQSEMLYAVGQVCLLSAVLYLHLYCIARLFSDTNWLFSLSL